MTTPNNPIETYRDKVNTIKDDLATLKQETDELLKQQQAEDIESKAEKTKKEIEDEIEKIENESTEGLEELKNELQAMLDELEGFLEEITTLKASVIAWLTEVDETLPMVNTAPEFEKIQRDMEELKTMVNELEGSIDEYKKNKKTLSEEEKKAQEKEIAEKQTAIREKKKSIQEAINTIKKTRKDFDINRVLDEEMQTILKDQKQKDLQKIADLQKELDAISIPASNFLETIQNGADKTLKRVKRNPWATWGIVAGSVLLVWWMAGWFKRKNKETPPTTTTQPTNNETPKKWFWQRWYGKALKWGLIGTGAFFGIKWLIDYFNKGKDKDKKSPVRGHEYHVDNFDDYCERYPENGKQYNKLWKNINLMYDDVMNFEKDHLWYVWETQLGTIGDIVDERRDVPEDEKIKREWLVPWALDRYYKNIDVMLSYGGVDKYIGLKNRDEWRRDLKEWWVDKVQDMLIPYLSTLASWWTAGIVPEDTIEEKMNKFLDDKKEGYQQKQAEVNFFFRQYTKVLLYMADKKNAIKRHFAIPILKKEWYKSFRWTISRPSDTKEQEKMVLEAINDEKWIKEKITDVSYKRFLNSNIVESSRILEW